MDSSSRDGLTKRALDASEVLSEEEVVEKRPRLESGVSDISDAVREETEVEIPSNSEVEEQEEPSSTEVIYELSPDNDSSLLSVSEGKSPAHKESPGKLNRSEESHENEEISNEESEGEESDGGINQKQEEEGKMEDEGNSEASGESSSSDGGDDDNDSAEDENDVEKEHAGKGKVGNEDIDGHEDTKEDKESEVSEDEIKKPKLEMLSDDDDSESDEPEQRQDKERSTEKSPKVVKFSEESSSKTKSVTEKEADDIHGEKRMAASSDEEYRAKGSTEKKADDMADSGRPLGKSADYSKKSVEDLEDLQEDIHKELAQINEKRRKHKKTSSSWHREKRHKEKSSSRHKERGKERSNEAHGGSRKDPEKRRKNRDHDADEKAWLHEAKREKSEKNERRERGGKSDSVHGRSERSPKRLVTKSNSSRRDGQDSRVSKVESTSKESKPASGLSEGKKNGGKKGPISDSMREMLRARMKELESEKPKDLRGFNTEIVEYESDESQEHPLDVQMSDVSSPSSSENESDDPESSPEVPKLPPYFPAIRGCRNVEEFEWLNRIEEGTYGVVYRAKDRRTGEIVALKKLKMEKEKEGFPITSLREINTLLKAQHPNIVTVQEIVVGSNMDKIYIVMDFVEHDLKALMETMTQSFLAGEIKTIMIQLLRAVSHLHDNWILHRDIKTSNLLLSNKGILKVGDFGLAREYGSPLKPYTPIVVTLWYRAPELLLGAKEYSTPIDLWSVGCVLAELLTMKPLFNGQSEISQINKIFKELGTPSDKIWPGPPAYSEYPATKKMTFAEYPYNNLRNRFGATLTDNGFDLLNSFLTYDPKRRITAEKALQHEFFMESPKPVDPSMFPSWPARSEGAKRTKKASPKAPEGGNFYNTLSGDGDGAFHIPAGRSQGPSAVPGFTLRF